MNDGFSPVFLIAAPSLGDPNFHQSVILLMEQTEDGSMGVVLNRESPILLKDLCVDQKIPYEGDPDRRVRFGGPVSPEHGIVLYRQTEHEIEGDLEVFGSWKVSTSQGTLGRLAADGDPHFLCFTGYSGWGPGQLESELKEGSWIVVPADPEMLFETEPDAFWSRALKQNGIDPAYLVPGGAEA